MFEDAYAYEVWVGEKTTDAELATAKNLHDLGFEMDPQYPGQMIYKTTDEKKFENIKKKLKKILEPFLVKNGLDIEAIASIVTQPECPECKRLGRFSEQCCSQCGVELSPRQHIEF